MFSGTFKTKNDVKSFCKPLKILSAFVENTGVILNIKRKNDKIIGKISTLNNGSVIFINYKNIFDDFKFDEEEIKIGIVKLTEFINLFSVFEEDAIKINFGKDKSFSISQNKNKITYQTADLDVCKEFTKNLANVNWLCTFNYDDNFSKFTKAMSVLSNEPFVFINGYNTNNNLILTIKNTGVSINSYSVEIPANLTTSFETVFKKDTFQTILGNSFNTMKISVSDKFSLIECEDKDFDMIFCVAKAII
jgi:hypothetical protein